MMNSAATVALGFPTSFGLGKGKQNHDSTRRRHEALPEEELTIKIADIDGVHVDDMDVLEASEGEIREDFTA